MYNIYIKNCRERRWCLSFAKSFPINHLYKHLGSSCRNKFRRRVINSRPIGHGKTWIMERGQSSSVEATLVARVVAVSPGSAAAVVPSRICWVAIFEWIF